MSVYIINYSCLKLLNAKTDISNLEYFGAYHSSREAEICAILLPLRCAFAWYDFFAKVKFFIFWPKTMDYSQAFGPKLRSMFVLLLLLAGRCYEAEFAPFCSPEMCFCAVRFFAKA